MRQGVPKVNGVSLPFAQQNAGKSHLCIDISQTKGRHIVCQLAEQADILVENYRPGVASRLGVGYDDICQINPEIIYCSISGYGQFGSAANRRAYAPVIHAELGLLHLNATERGTDPMPEAVSHVDFAVGAQATGAILAALFHKERHGCGQHIDVSMAETMLATNEFAAIEMNGGFGDEISPFRPGKAALLKLGDGSWVQVPGNPTTWIFGVARALNKEKELQDRGWFSPVETQGKDDEIRALMQLWAQEYNTVAAFEAALDTARIPLGTVKSVAQVIEEQWVTERQAVIEVDINGEPKIIPRSPARFSGAETGPRSGARLRGADNRQVLGDMLGLSEEELDVLEREGVLLGE